MTFGSLDMLLIVVVSIFGTAIAYISNPVLKALVLAIPLPFTIATLALQYPVGVCHVVGAMLLIVYANMVRYLYSGLHWHIIASIACSAFCYCVMGFLFRSILPENELAFWIAFIIVFSVALLLVVAARPSSGQNYRTSLPLVVKLPAIASVVIMLICAKNLLHGFIAAFPMVGITAAYEIRHNLSIMCRKISLCVVFLLILIAAAKLSYPFVGLGKSLAVGWLCSLVCLSITICIRKQIVFD